MRPAEALRHISGIAQMIGVVQGLADTRRREGDATYADYLDRVAADSRKHLDAMAEARTQNT